jgi:hypothetical protein
MMTVWPDKDNPKQAGRIAVPQAAPPSERKQP